MYILRGAYTVNLLLASMGILFIYTLSVNKVEAITFGITQQQQFRTLAKECSSNQCFVQCSW